MQQLRNNSQPLYVIVPYLVDKLVKISLKENWFEGKDQQQPLQLQQSSLGLLETYLSIKSFPLITAAFMVAVVSDWDFLPATEPKCQRKCSKA